MGKKKIYFNKSNRSISKIIVSKLWVIISAWIFQGFLYMNIFEKAYKVFLETFLILFFFTIFSYIKPQLSIFESFILCFLVAHTITWFFNGQVMTMLIHMDLIPNKPEKFIDYTDGLVHRIITRKFINGAAIYGSITKCQFKKTSDLDVRIIMKKGIFNRFLVCHFCFIERLLAFFRIYPIDIFTFEFNELKNKMSPDEDPIILCDPSGQLRPLYQCALSYEAFRKAFRAKYV